MRRFTLFLAGVAIVGNLAIAQDNRNDLRVMVSNIRIAMPTMEKSATEAMPAGITHVHIQVPDVAAAVARLRQLGLPAPARGATTPKTATDPGVTQPSNVKSANVYDPQGLRLELNELIPESQTKKAMDAWK